MLTLTKFFSLGLPNLGVQFKCPQSLYTAVQIDLKYLLDSLLKYS